MTTRDEEVAELLAQRDEATAAHRKLIDAARAFDDVYERVHVELRAFGKRIRELRAELRAAEKPVERASSLVDELNWALYGESFLPELDRDMLGDFANAYADALAALTRPATLRKEHTAEYEAGLRDALATELEVSED